MKTNPCEVSRSATIPCKVLVVGNYASKWKANRSVCEDLSDRLSAVGYVVFRTSGKRWPLWRLVDMLRTTWVKRHCYAVAQIDVYSGSAFFWVEAVVWLLRRLNKPYILTLRGGNLPIFARRWPWRVRHLFEAAYRVTTPSRYLLEEMSCYYGKLVLLPNPIDLHAYNFRLRQEPQPRLIWLRAFHAIYNPRLAPRVLSLLRKQFPNIQLIMIGPDKGDGSLQTTQQVAQELGLLDAITFSGGIAKRDVGNWMNKGDIFINTTNIDNTPVSVLEAMACGLCVVSTNVGGIPYLLEHEQNALLVPTNDPHSMADAVSRILSEPKFAEMLSYNARKEAEQFDWSKILPQWQELLLQTVTDCKGNS